MQSLLSRSNNTFSNPPPLVDPNFVRVSLEEQRQRQEEENKSSGGVGETTPSAGLGDNVDLSQLSEEEQIALAMQMSLAVRCILTYTLLNFSICKFSFSNNYAICIPIFRRYKFRSLH